MKLYVRLAALILVSQMAIGCETLKEVDKALYEVSEAAAPRDQITGERTLSFDGRADQILKGNAAIEAALKTYRKAGEPLNEEVDAKGYAKLQRITRDILSVSHFADENWTVLLFPDQEFNAYVTGGTYIVVFKGLLNGVQSDDEIAAVIGHEIAHVAAGHISERSAHTTVFGLVRKKSTARAGYTEAYTNLNEQEADKIGVIYASLAGYDPYAASRLWFRQSQEGREAWNYFRSHPTSSDRASATRSYADTAMQYYTYQKANPDFLSLLDCNAIWCKKESGLKAGEGGGLSAILESSLKAYTDHLRAETERLKQQNKIMAEANSQSYGILAPTEDTRTALGASTETIRLGQTYQGRTSYYGKAISGRIVTQFSQDPSGYLVGRYIETVNGKQSHGTMKMVREISKDQYEFEWTNDGLSGKAHFRFTRYGSFRGQWEFEHRGETWRGSWDGRSN